MRILIALLLLPRVLCAEVLMVESAPTAVEIQSEQAQVTRVVSFSMPTGQHSIVLPDLPTGAFSEGMRAQLDGAVLQSLTVRKGAAPLPPKDDRPEVATAEAALEQTQTALQVVQDQIAALKRQANAAKAQSEFLEALSGSETLPQDAAALAEIAQMIGSQTKTALDTAAAARIAMRPLAREADTLKQDVARAEAALKALLTPDTNRQHVTLIATAPTAGEVTLRLTYLAGWARWQPAYALRLTNEGAPGLQIDRAAWVSQDTGEDWTNVALTLSTADTASGSAPGQLYPRLLQVIDPGALVRDSALKSLADEPVVEEAIVARNTATLLEGASARYVFAAPVTIANGADQLSIALDSANFDTTLFARAVPAQDEAAFRIASITNTLPEILLPGPAELFVDGQLIGFGQVPLLAPGAQADLPMGPVETLRLSRILHQGTGDTGIITRATERTTREVLRVENTGNTAWDIELMGQVPYSEQEELEINWTATPAPTTRDVKDAQGVLSWRYDLPPGVTKDVSLNTRITWPAGLQLR